MLNKNVLNNIHQDILELSSQELQLKSWLSGESETISNYTELMCRLFDDNAFDQFVDKDVYVLNVSENMIGNLKELRRMLDNYDIGDKSYEEVIYDPHWAKIRERAKIIIDNWAVEFAAQR